MTPFHLRIRIPALFLALTVSLPNSALALRPEGPGDSRPLQQKLRAGLEESAFERRINDQLESLWNETQQRLGVSVWVEQFPKEKVKAIANAFLDHPDPVAAKKDVRELMDRINQQILRPLRAAAPRTLSPEMEELRELAFILPVADDWLVYAYSPPARKPGEYERRTRALAVYSRRAAALAWGRNGPHLRADFVPFDRDDVRLAPILLRAFLPETRQLLARIRRQERVSGRLKQKAEEHAGLLFNGLIIPDENGSLRPLEIYQGSFAQWAAASGGRLRRTIELAAVAFPEKFPLEPARMPGFLRFANTQFAHQEISPMRDFNRRYPSRPLTLWQLTAGTGATEEYLLYLNTNEPGPLDRHDRLAEQVYAHVLQQSGAVPRSAAGAEEDKREGAYVVVGSGKNARFHKVNEKEVRAITPNALQHRLDDLFDAQQQAPPLGFAEDAQRHLYIIYGESKAADENRARQFSRHNPILERVIYGLARKLGVNVAEILIPTPEERRELTGSDRLIFLRQMVPSYQKKKRVGVFQRNPRKAFTRAFVVLGLLARIWDLHKGNSYAIPRTKIPMFFDLEEGANPFYSDMRLYAKQFIVNFYQLKVSSGQPLFQAIAPDLFLDELDWEEWTQSLEAVEDADLQDLKIKIKQEIAEEGFLGALPAGVSREIDGYFGLLADFKESFREKTQAFWEVFLGWPRLEGGKHRPIPPSVSGSRFQASTVTVNGMIQTGAEEKIDEIAAIAEEAAQGGGAVIVDAAGVEEQPLLQAFLERFTPGPGSAAIVLGDSPAARDLRENSELFFAGGLGELAGLLMGLKEARGITHVTYLSGSGIFQVRPVAQEIGLSFAQRPVSLETLLAGFMPASLAAGLAAGMEEAGLLEVGT